MSFEPVDFYVADKTPLASPVESVLIKVYDAAGSIFFTQATTDADGHAGFLLETQQYSARFYKAHVEFTQPQLFEVLAAPETNSFNVSADVLVPPIATDPRLCRASGFFRELTGGPKRFLDIHFIARFAPILLEGDAIFTERVAIRTDEQGYAVIDLIRGACYDAYIEGLEDTPRYIAVPDSASVNLPDLLLPVVASITLDPPGPYDLTVGQELIVTPTVVTSDGRPLTGAAVEDVQWTSSDDQVAAVFPSSTTLTLRGIAAGTADIQAVRLNQTIIRIPNTPIEGQPVAITVT
jgi:uncharacterized protein YjdB